MAKDLDKNAKKRFTMQPSEMSKGTSTKKGELCGRDLMKRVRKNNKQCQIGTETPYLEIANPSPQGRDTPKGDRLFRI